VKDILQLLGYVTRIAGDAAYLRPRIALIVLSGLASGGGNIVLLAMINSFIQAPGAVKLLQVLGFASICVLVAGSRFLSQYLLAGIASNALLNLRMKLCRQILATPLRKLEEVGQGRMLAHLTDDVSALSEALVQIPVVIVNVAIVIAGLGYLGWLSLGLLLFILISMTLGIALYRVPAARSMELFRQARESWNGLFTGFQGVTLGVKELQLHAGRRKSFYESNLLHLGKRIQQFSLHGYTVLAAANSWGQVLFFAALGAVLFAAPELGSLDHETASGYALVLLFLIGPVEAILNAFPAMARARSSAEQLNAVGLMLGKPQQSPVVAAEGRRSWSSIELREVTHTYFREHEENGFTLGPINLRLEPGEIVFVVGGNGSGKTTLAKLIVGLYEPESGTILLDGKPVGDFESYRQLFSAVFSDFYLFQSLSGLAAGDVDLRARGYLERLRLEKKVSVEQERLSTINLSQGQRKRLSLLTAWMEDRPIYLFDEWSSDQDALYREFFYRDVLPGLREMAKAVIVITHDERYRDAADRIIELDYGQIVRISRKKEQLLV
jgi:putative pyoverdin transport system ATP-binding/permease protein